MITALIEQNDYLVAAMIMAASLCLLLLLLTIFKRHQARSLRIYRRLAATLFSCLTSRDYPEKIYDFEQRIQYQKIKCLKRMPSVRHKKTADVEWPLFDIIVDIGQIRHRVTDHTVFALCERELAVIADAVDSLLAVVKKNDGLEQKLAALEQSINQFEDVFEHVVKVAAREPAVFILFISALRALKVHCQAINVPLSKHDAAGMSKADVSSELVCVDYPDWVFAPEMNRHFRSQTTLLKIQLSCLADALLSMNYHVKQPIDASLSEAFLPALGLVAERNNELFSAIYAFCANQAVHPLSQNLTDDVETLQNTLQTVLPDSLELLDVSPDYIVISALARDAIDMRNMLLKILADLPLDDRVVAA